MKKFIMMVVAAMMATVSVNAQTEAGQFYLKPMVGGTLAKLTGTDAAKFKLGLVGGAEVGYQIADPFAITAGVLASMQGAKYKDDKYSRDGKATLTYLNIPILANLYIVKGLAIKAGVQPGFLLSAKSKGEELVDGQWYKFDESGTEDMEKFDFSIPVGLSYEFSNFIIDARYNIGLTNVSKTAKALDTSIKNSVFMLTVGYKIHL